MMAVALSGCTGATNTVEMPENPEPPPGIPTAEGATPGEVAVP